MNKRFKLMNTANTKAHLIALIGEHESDYWLALANGWGGSEELGDAIERLRDRLEKLEATN